MPIRHAPGSRQGACPPRSMSVWSSSPCRLGRPQLPVSESTIPQSTVPILRDRGDTGSWGWPRGHRELHQTDTFREGGPEDGNSALGDRLLGVARFGHKRSRQSFSKGIYS
ncbi:hypothetical protein EYF80_059609 [Liparis tanakae]|uniref:Uncharacterized protein n=1 Tax=Liparis tanakae TaxID=230148 RepID=A0A4Z2ENB0_9TELE|nr:hypothetical protein EYF80_059609 [Liparis tanakae]